MLLILKIMGDVLEQNMITIIRSVIAYATILCEFSTNANKHLKIILSSILWHRVIFMNIFLHLMYVSKLWVVSKAF